MIYFKHYEKGHAHAYGFFDIAHFMAGRTRLQTQWLEFFEPRILTVGYEALIRDSGAVAAQIATHAGLELDPEIPLPEFHDDEIGIWKHYDKHLQPLRDALREWRLM